MLAILMPQRFFAMEKFIKDIINQMASELKGKDQNSEEFFKIKKKYRMMLSSVVFKARLKKIQEHITDIASTNKARLSLNFGSSGNALVSDTHIVANGTCGYGAAEHDFNVHFIAKYQDKLSVDGDFTLIGAVEGKVN